MNFQGNWMCRFDMKENMKIKNGGLLIITIILIFIVFLIFELVLSYFSTFVELGNQKSDWGTFGDFVGGTLNPLLSFLGFLALLYTISIQRKQIAEDKKDREKQQFESTFFALLNMHNQALKDLPEYSLINTYNNVFSKNPTLAQANARLKSDQHSCCHYFRVLCQLLSFIVQAPNESERIYSNIVRSLLTDKVMRLFLIYCCYENEQDEKWQYKLLIDRYAIFEYASFNKNLGNDGEEIIVLAGAEKSAIYEAKKFYDKKAFGL